MKVLKLRRELPKGSRVIELSADDVHDLKVIAEIPYQWLQGALKESTHPWANKEMNCQTHGVYGLLAKIRGMK